MSKYSHLVHFPEPPDDFDIKSSERVKELRYSDLWVGQNDHDWHSPILLTVRDNAFKNYRKRNIHRWNEKHTKYESKREASDAKKYILGEILWVGTHLKNSSKGILALELSYYFESIVELKTIYEALGSEHILNIIIRNYNGRLEDINNKLYGELKEVR